MIAGSKAQQQVEHDHRIDAARNGEDNTLPPSQHPMPVDRLLNPIKQCVSHRFKPANRPLKTIRRWWLLRLL